MAFLQEMVHSIVRDMHGVQASDSLHKFNEE